MTTRLDPRFLTIPLAHRGLHDRKAGIVENSASAIQAAINAGYGIEIDVQPSRSQTPMVFHDARLDRLTDLTGPVRDRTTPALEATRYCDGPDRISTLDDILARISGSVPLLIEIKDQDGGLGPNMGDLPGEVARALTNYAGPVAVMSFNPHAMQAFATHAPDIARGLVTEHFDAADWPDVPAERRAELNDIPDAARLSLDFISHNHKHLTVPPVARLKAAGLPIFCWTIRNRKDEAKARLIADNITFEAFRPDPAPATAA